jgi:ornithine cyclodeaminase/alanine dehydrogenase-like protein (mu-crystallin family)
MKTTIISAYDLRYIVNHIGLDELMDEMIRRLTVAFSQHNPGETVIPVRGGFKYSHPHLGLIEWMPGMRVGEGVYIKMVGYHPNSGVLNGLPTILSTQSMYSVNDGHMICLMDASFTTALRTGATSAVASRLLARPGSAVIGLVGTGAQAVTQLHALSRVFPIEKVYLFDIDIGSMESFPARVASLNLDRLSMESGPVEDWIKAVDILVTATSVGIGDGPVFPDAGLQEHIHINAVGSDFPGKFEVPKTVLARALVCPDFPEQAAAEGECQRMMPEDIGPDILTLFRERDRFNNVQQRCTVFDSTGWALEDIVTIDLFREYAGKFKVGSEIQLETISTDHRNPYQFLADHRDDEDYGVRRKS